MCGVDIWSRAPDFLCFINWGHSLIGGADQWYGCSLFLRDLPKSKMAPVFHLVSLSSHQTWGTLPKKHAHPLYPAMGGRLLRRLCGWGGARFCSQEEPHVQGSPNPEGSVHRLYTRNSDRLYTRDRIVSARGPFLPRIVCTRSAYCYAQEGTGALTAACFLAFCAPPHPTPTPPPPPTPPQDPTPSVARERVCAR